jgi:general secretion pathway protein N
MVLNMLRNRRNRRFAGSVVPSQWQESTFAEIAWEQSRKAAFRWAVAGALLGTLIGLVTFAPAAWMANAVARATNQQVLLADARGTIWSGSAVAVLTGGPDSRDASALPGRIDWSLGLRGRGFGLRLRHACCLNGTVEMLVQPGLGRMSVTLLPQAGWVGQWPAAFLGGLGTPWNTLQLGGALRLVSPGGMTMDLVQGRWLLQGQANLELLGVSSRLSTLDTLGSYRLSVIGGGTDSAQPSRLELVTLSGALQLSGSGTVNANGVSFRGEASAADANESALTNLLNIIGRRNGARSVISIGRA